MNVHNLEFVGKFIVEFIYSHGVWTDDDIGSLIYDVKRQQYFVGGYDDWILFNMEFDLIKFNHIDIGYLDHQMSSKWIPSEYGDMQISLQQTFDAAKFDIEIADYDHSSLTREVFDITAIGFNTLDDFVVEDRLVSRIRDNIDGLVLNDSSSFVNPMLVQEALLLLELDTTSHTAITITSFDSTSFIQESLDGLNWDDPPRPNLNALNDYIDGSQCDSTSVVELYFKTTSIDCGLHCVMSSDLLMNVAGPSVIPDIYPTFQSFISSCGTDFKSCIPYVIPNILIFDDWEDFVMLRTYYEYNHTQYDPNIMYDFMNSQVLKFYNGSWIVTTEYNISELSNNTIYSIPVTNTMFYIDMNSIYLKIFDRKRYGL